MIKLKKFQKEKVQELINYAQEQLNIKDTLLSPPTIILEAPTGSGKTIILAGFIKEFFLTAKFNFNKANFVFLWFSPGKGGLYIQSKKKLQEILVSSNYEVFFLEEALKSKILANSSVIVINWEKVTKKNNRLLQENENFNLKDFQSKDYHFISIIDEEHYNRSKKAKTAIDLFKSKIIIRTSATLSRKTQQDMIKNDRKVKVQRQDVIDAGLIKKNYQLNYDIFAKEAIYVNNVLGDDAILLNKALQKRTELQNKFILANSNVNPLIVIQLSDEKDQFIKNKNAQVVQFLAQKELTFQNQLLAIDLDKHKENLEGLKINNSLVQCIITKQTITQGWDCPRAHILVKLRGNSHRTFNIQTLGRISRMPEINKVYKDDALNSGYVYTWDKTLLQIKDSDSSQTSPILSYQFFLSIKKEHKFSLPSRLTNQKHFLTSQEKTDDVFARGIFKFSQAFNQWWREKIEGISLKESAKNNSKIKKVLESYAKFGFEVVPELEVGVIEGSFYDKDTSAKKVKITYQEDGILALENKFKNDFCLRLAQKLKISNYENIQQIFDFLFSFNPWNSLDKSKSSFDYIYDFDIWGSNNQKKQALFYCFFLNSKEKWFKHFQDFFTKLNTEIFNKNITILKTKFLTNFTFSDPEEFSFKLTNKEDYLNKKLPERNNCLYQGFIAADKYNFSQPEIDFINKVLESHAYANQIDWWYRNQENKNSTWKIIYLDKTNQARFFYPDFILQIRGKIWIIEIKDQSNLDKNNSEKFAYLKEFCQYHHLNFAFVIVNDGNIKINFQEWSLDYNDPNKWQKLDQLFLKN